MKKISQVLYLIEIISLSLKKQAVTLYLVLVFYFLYGDFLLLLVLNFCKLSTLLSRFLGLKLVEKGSLKAALFILKIQFQNALLPTMVILQKQLKQTAFLFQIF